MMNGYVVPTYMRDMDKQQGEVDSLVVDALSRVEEAPAKGKENIMGI